MHLISVVLLAFCMVLSDVSCYRILGVFPNPAKSHYLVGDALMKGLAAKGHDVTMISAYKQIEPIKNFRAIHLEHSRSDAVSGTENNQIFQINSKYSFFVFFHRG